MRATLAVGLLQDCGETKTTILELAKNAKGKENFPPRHYRAWQFAERNQR